MEFFFHLYLWVFDYFYIFDFLDVDAVCMYIIKICSMRTAMLTFHVSEFGHMRLILCIKHIGSDLLHVTHNYMRFFFAYLYTYIMTDKQTVWGITCVVIEFS